MHYFATRLFDLDFARLGRIERAPGREELIDFPRGTGQIAYRKLVIEDGRLVGALMIGERALRGGGLAISFSDLALAAVFSSLTRRASPPAKQENTKRKSPRSGTLLQNDFSL